MSPSVLCPGGEGGGESGETSPEAKSGKGVWGCWGSGGRGRMAKCYGDRSRLVKLENVGGLNEFSVLHLLLFTKGGGGG